MRKYRFTNNIGLKIIALVFSAFLWLIVVNVDNPIGSSTFSEIPVHITNDDIITSSGEVYQVIGEQTVSVTVYATREVRQKLTAEDIIATANIREMSGSLVPVSIEIPDYEGDYETAYASPRNLQIQTEKSGRKVLPLTVSTQGDVRDGYILGDMTVHPDNVTITGAESTLDRIDRAVARIDVNDLYEDAEITAELILYDSNGNVISQNQLENNLGSGGVSVSVEVLEVKSVPVVFSVSGTPAEGYDYTGCTSEPDTVQICGKSEDIDSVQQISVPASVISVSGASEPIEQDVDITPYLPEGVSLVDENMGTVKVTAMIEEEGTRTIDFLVSSIRINNLADSLQVSYEPDAEITLRFSGEQQSLDVLDISSAVSVDLQEYTEPGTYDVPVHVEIPDGITLMEEVTVRLTIEEKTEEVPGEGSGESEEDGQNSQSGEADSG